MSRSRRTTPICGHTRAASDKPFKATEHRRERRAVRMTLLDDDEIPSSKRFGNPWAAPKDGKHMFDPRRHPKIMRK